jgi:cob(I)alamin adenosyltransferase
MIHVYFGNGKGKTTAAFGLAMRAKGRGFKVCAVQFLKNEESGETISAKALGIEVYQFGNPWFVINVPNEEDFKMAEKGFKFAVEKIYSKKYDLIILDEINVALFYKLLNIDDVLGLLNKLPSNLEIVLTGRYAPQELIDKADLVTEMKEIKHYYTKGVLARIGIEK